jgi:hypothetical protein
VNSEYICSRLKKIIIATYAIDDKREYFKGAFARETEDGLFTFGTKHPLTRNTVTKRIALFLITNKIPEDEKTIQTPSCPIRTR